MWGHALFTYLRRKTCRLSYTMIFSLYKINMLKNNVQNDTKTLFKRYIVAWKVGQFCTLLWIFICQQAPISYVLWMVKLLNATES